MVKFLIFPTHAGVPPCRTLPEEQRPGRDIWTTFTPLPHLPWPGILLTSQLLSRVAIVSPEKALFSEVLPAKCMSSTFPLLETFLPAFLQPQPRASPCPGPRWREVTQAE